MPEFTPNPYWGDLDETKAVLVQNVETAQCGLAVYGGDGTGQADGRQIDFVTLDTLRGDAMYPALHDAGYDGPYSSSFIVNYHSPISVPADEWERLTFPGNWPSTSEKFSDGLAERLYDADLEGGLDESLGEAETFGYYAVSFSDSAILAVNSQGFVSATGYADGSKARDAWADLGREYERFCMSVWEDGLPTGSCDEIFLIFDTARHVNSVPDAQRVIDHVSECETCHPFRSVLDE